MKHPEYIIFCILVIHSLIRKQVLTTMKMETISVYKIVPYIRFYISDHLFSYYKIQKSTPVLLNIIEISILLHL